MAGDSVLFCFFLIATSLLAGSLDGVRAIDYRVENQAPNTRGGTIFNNAIGIDATRRKMADATQFIWNLLNINNPGDRRNVQQVALFIIDEGNNGIPAKTDINNQVMTFNAFYITDKTEFDGVLYHEMTHVWQWYVSTDRRSAMLSEGIADFVRLKGGYGKSEWVKGGGQAWDAGYGTTARFLEYCDDRRNGFVAELNKMMRMDYSDNYFNQLMGESADQLWASYKAQYGNLP